MPLKQALINSHFALTLLDAPKLSPAWGGGPV
jgi:hypothetical protein